MAADWDMAQSFACFVPSEYKPTQDARAQTKDKAGKSTMKDGGKVDSMIEQYDGELLTWCLVYFISLKKDYHRPNKANYYISGCSR